MKKILVHTCVGYNFTRGGALVLYILCYFLNKLGAEAYVTVPAPHRFYGDEVLPFKPPQTCNMDEFIVIYPEIVNNNPLNAKHIVRWNLSPWRLANARKDRFLQDYKLFNIHKHFSVGELTSHGLLTCFYVDHNLFYNRNLPRDGTSFLYRKGSKRPGKRLHQDDALDFELSVHRSRDREQFAANHFNTIKTFYCYDNDSGWVVLAALCGCEVIVIPQLGTTRTAQEWYASSPMHRYGVAFGVDEIEHAKTTLHLVKENILTEEKNNLKTVQSFISFCEKEF